MLASIASGSCRASAGAKSAARRRRAKTAAPTTRRGLARKRATVRPRTRDSRVWAGLGVADSWVEVAIQQVHRQVDDDQQARRDEHDALDGRVVAAIDGRDQERAQS